MLVHEKAQELHEYGMPMPASWIAARQHFIDNLAKPKGERERCISKEDFIKPCDFADTPFEKLQGLPKKARPVTTFPNRDEAFTEIVRGVRRAIV
ncbi:MAG: hypothetical protein AAFZ15_06880 [Bacteroidota bacterium]